MCLATTETGPMPENPTWDQKVRAVFDPILKEDKKESFELKYRDWFVTTNEVIKLIMNFI